MQTTDGQKYRVRYSGYSDRDPLLKLSTYRNLSPQRTLVTLQKGDTVYFGIARCNLKADKFEKKIGRALALCRALEAVDLQNVMVIVDTGTFYIDKTGLRGWVNVKLVKVLLRYFETEV